MNVFEFELWVAEKNLGLKIEIECVCVRLNHCRDTISLLDVRELKRMKQRWKYR